MSIDMDTTQQEDKNSRLAGTGLVDSHGITIDLPDSAAPSGRPKAVSHVSAPAYHSPLRHHRRESSRSKTVIETLNAKSSYADSEDDSGPSIHKINQYIIKQEIGRGSYGSVHLAVDQYGTEYAVKEFSKSRLRKRAQSDLLRRPSRRTASARLAPGGGFNSPLHRHKPGSSEDSGEVNAAFDLIKGEIAVMKKLNHPNVVSLIEVLDDAEEDSLYMVLEMCKKGVVMQVGLDETADPYDQETCRCWFRDMVLGLEYLHAQGIIHRDIKPDNCLVTHDDVLKYVDFGVSEMFTKESDMRTAKSAGSPAFMPPELCVAKHGSISGKAADIWSMGVTLYCLRYGRIPFERHHMLDLYEAIRAEKPSVEGEDNEHFIDLIMKLLEKDPDKRIVMKDIRVHPWVTKNGQDPLLSEEENCEHIIGEPTQIEVNHAITGKMGHLLAVAKAAKRFKKLLIRKRPELMDTLLGNPSRLVKPPSPIREGYGIRQSRSHDNHDRRPVERVLTAEGIHHEFEVSDTLDAAPASTTSPNPSSKGPTRADSSRPSQPTSPSEHRQNSGDGKGRGHAHDPLTDTLFLNIGTGFDSPVPSDPTSPTVCESPGGVDENIYEKAYEEEMDRIIQQRGKAATIFLTRRVEHKDELLNREGIVGVGQMRGSTMPGGMGGGSGMAGLAGLVKKAREAGDRKRQEEEEKEEKGKSEDA